MVMPRRPIYGVGINDSDYLTQETVNGKRVICPFYNRWKCMLERCYSRAYKVRTKSNAYEGFTVCEEWFTFSNFKSWVESQPCEGVGLDLDKDMLVPGNKVYSPETCVFVPRSVNVLFTDRRNTKGEYPLGVHKRKRGKDMINDYSRPFVAEGFIDGSNRHLGVYTHPMEAHRAWQLGKIKAMRAAVEEWKGFEHYDERVGRTLLSVADKIQSDFDLERETVKYENVIPRPGVTGQREEYTGCNDGSCLACSTL